MIRIPALAILLALTQQQPRDGSLEITVRDSVTHKGIPAVQVTLTLHAPEPPNIVRTFFTNSEGRVVAGNLEYGLYVMKLERDGYRAPGRPTPNDNSSTINLWTGPERPKYEAEPELTPIATLTGRVLDPNRNPLPNVDVSLLPQTYRNGHRILSTDVRSGARTDDRGVFRLTGIPPGEYYLRVDTSRLLGLDKGPDDLPRFTYYPGVTDPMVAAPVTVGSNGAAVDIQLPRQSVYKISGTVIGSLAGGYGSFYLGFANPDTLETPVQVTARTAPSSEPNEVQFEIAGIPAGEYVLYPFYQSETSYVTSRTLVSVTDRNVDGLRIVLRPNVDLQGRIVADGDASAIRWDALRVFAHATHHLPVLLRAGDTMGASVTDPRTGEFVVRDRVPDERLAIQVFGLPPDGYVSDIRQDGRSVHNEGFVRSSSNPIDVHVDLGGGTIAGTVRDALNRVAKKASVTLVPDTPRRANSLLYKRATTDSNGEFILHGIAPGEYQLFAWSATPPGGADENAEYLAPYEGKGSIIKVSPRTRTEAQIRLLPR
jgi:hypothetical protein